MERKSIKNNVRSLFRKTRVILLIILFSLSVTQPISNDIDKPRAVIHIGPPKSGSTHLQSLLESETNLLKMGNFVNIRGCTGSFLQVKQLFSRQRYNESFGSLCPLKVDYVDHLISGFRENNKNVVISSEYLFRTTKPQLFEEMKDFFHGFHINIVFMYRQLINQEISRFNQAGKFNQRRWENHKWPKPVFFSALPAPQNNYYFPVYEQYRKEIPHANFTVIDYYGALGSGRDIADVFFCGVLGVPCEGERANFSSVMKRDNPSEVLDIEQIVELFHEYVGDRNCSFQVEVVEDIRNFNWTGLNNVPKIDIDVSFLRNYSLLEDEKIRKVFSPFLLFGDRGANEEAVRNLKIQEIDQIEFKSSTEWEKDFLNAFQFFKSQQKIQCDS